MSVSAFLFATLAISYSSFAVSQTDWKVSQTFHIGGEGGWDYITVDPATNLLYVTRTTHTQVIDGETGKVVADIPGQKRAHGVALVPEVGRGFISDGGGTGAIVVFNLKSNAVVGTIPAMPDTDGIIYDKAINRVLAVSGDGSALMVLDPSVDQQHGKIEETIELGGKPEFLAADDHGRAYVNLEDKDLVAVVDLREHKVTDRWPVAPGGQPVGMAMDEKERLLFIGCRKPQKMIIMNARDGKIVSDVAIGAGVDATKFDGKQAFASCRDGKLHIVSTTAPGKFAVVETVTTPEGARTMTVNAKTHTAYLPTAEFLPSNGQGRPTPKPGSFMIVVVTHK